MNLAVLSVLLSVSTLVLAAPIVNSWPCSFGNSQRSSRTLVAQMQKQAELGFYRAASGKSHGSPVVTENDDVFYVQWNTSGPFVNALRADGSTESASIDVPPGADIISDSFDPIIYNEIDGGTVCTTLASYNTSNVNTVVISCYSAKNLTLLWSQQTNRMLDAVAFVTTETQGLVLVALVSSDRALRILDPLTGALVQTASWATGSCNWRSSLSVTSDSVVYVLCIDNTFGNNLVIGLNTKTNYWSVSFKATYQGLNSYWPPALAYWDDANVILGLTAKNIWALNPNNGSQIWKNYLPPVYVSTLLGYAMGSYSTDSKTKTQVLYLLTSGTDLTGYTYLLAYNSSGGQLSAAPAYLPVRVDRFLGTILLAPDGLTLTINGWLPNQISGQPVALTSVRFEPSSGKWTMLWTSQPWTGSQGRFCNFAAPLSNGSVVVAGWYGAYTFN